jgi:hypothetical protein
LIDTVVESDDSEEEEGEDTLAEVWQASASQASSMMRGDRFPCDD